MKILKTTSFPIMEDAIVSFLNQIDLINDKEEKLVQYKFPTLLLLITDTIGTENKEVREKVLNVLNKVSTAKLGSEEILKSDGISIITNLIRQNNDHYSAIESGFRVLASIAQLRGDSTVSNVVIPCVIGVLENVCISMDALTDPIHVYKQCVAQIFTTLSVFALSSQANKVYIANSSIPEMSKMIIPYFGNDSRVLGSCASMVANLSYQQPCVAHSLLASDMVDTLMRHYMDLVTAEDDEHVIHKMMVAIANLCNSVENSNIMYSIDGLVDFIVYLLQESDSALVIRNAAITCASMSFECAVIRRHFCNSNVIEKLVDIVLRLGMHEESETDKDDTMASEAASWALVVLCTSDKVAMQILESNSEDFQNLLHLYIQTESGCVLKAGAMLVSSLLPSTQTKRSLVTEGRISVVESFGGVKVINKCIENIYSCEETVLPVWLLQALSMLNNDTEVHKSLQASDLFEHDQFFQCLHPNKLV